MVYDVRVVEDTALPAGQDWALLEYDGRVTFVVKRSAVRRPQAITDAWAGYRLLARGHEPQPHSDRGGDLRIVV